MSQMTSVLQDSEISPQFRQEPIIPGLDSAADLQLRAAIQLNSAFSVNCGNHQVTNMAQFTQCFSNKSHSPSSDFSPQQPSSNRAAIQHPSSSGDQLLHNGCTRIQLPPSGLSRTLSAPIPIKNLHHLFSDGALPNPLINNSLIVENSGVNSASVQGHSSQKHLYRTYSAPIPEAYQAGATSATPRPPVAGKALFPDGLREQESPDTKKLRRMKDRLREMSKWWNEVIKEDEEEEEAGSEDNAHFPPKDDCEASHVTEVSETEEADRDQEAVQVERKGEVLILHFKCPCRKGYQILLSQKNCYYKLSSF